MFFALLAVAGLVTSLYVNRRRAWVRAGSHEDGRTMVEYGLLARGEDHRLAGEAAAIRALLAAAWPLDDSGSQPVPSAGADNDRADTGAGADAGPQSSPEQPATDSLQTTAGSPESKKDQ